MVVVSGRSCGAWSAWVCVSTAGACLWWKNFSTNMQPPTMQEKKKGRRQSRYQLLAAGAVLAVLAVLALYAAGTSSEKTADGLSVRLHCGCVLLLTNNIERYAVFDCLLLTYSRLPIQIESNKPFQISTCPSSNIKYLQRPLGIKRPGYDQSTSWSVVEHTTPPTFHGWSSKLPTCSDAARNHETTIMILQPPLPLLPSSYLAPSYCLSFHSL